MRTSRQLSLASAVLVNLNIIVGSGIFINTVLLARLAGIASALTYVVVGLLILPLMASFACLAHRHAGGSLYSYSVGLGDYWAFFSVWGYTLTKLASCTVAIHVCASLLSSIIPWLGDVPPLVLDMAVLCIFTTLNGCHAHVGSMLQKIFIVGKMVPIGTVLVVGAWYMSVSRVAISVPVSLAGVITGIPFVLYAFMGFESSAGFSRNIANPERNGWRVIALSFASGVLITTLFQLLLFYSVPALGSVASYRDVFPVLLTSWGVTGVLHTILLFLLHGGIAASAAGVGFGILYANVGNFLELAERNFLPRWLTYHNESGSPIYCALVESLLVGIYLYVGHASLPFLQQLAAFGATCTYIVSIIALFKDHCVSTRVRAIATLGLLSCVILLAASVRNFVIMGTLPLVVFVGIHLIGLLLFYIRCCKNGVATA